jgi:hypothetical protein
MNATAPSDSSLERADRLQRLSKKAPRGEVRLYRDDHFDIYVGEAFGWWPISSIFSSAISP